MPVHDWTSVDAGTFHAFHTAWITHLSETLNGGLLPSGYYAMPEQHAGRSIADVLTLHTGDGFLIPPRTRHNARDLGPGTGQMLSTYLVEVGQPLATLTP